MQLWSFIYSLAAQTLVWICLRLFWKKKKSKNLWSRVIQQLLLLLLLVLNILRSNAILAFLLMKFIHWNNLQFSEAFVIKFEMLAKCQSTFGKLPKDIFWRTLRIHVYFFFPFSKLLTEYRQTIASFEFELLFYVNKRQTVADTRHIQAAFVGISCVVINNSGYYFRADGSYSSTYINRKIDK